MKKFSYDPEVKILDIRLSKAKIVDSAEEGDCIFNYDSEGNIVNIEVLNFDLEKLVEETKVHSKQ